jgi:hypothetical protein
MADNYRVLKAREQSTMASAWDELLCVGFGTSKPYRLYLGNYAILGERAEYYDEETDDYLVPDEIRGRAVRGVKDDYIVGCDVEDVSQKPDDEFDFQHPSECEKWLVENHWLDDNLLAKIEGAIHALGAPQQGTDTPKPDTSQF